MYDKNTPTTIQNMFNSIAPTYDRANQILSFGLHEYWNHSLVKALHKKKQANTFLDLCCGTGEIAFTYLKHIRKKFTPHIILLDFSSQMLEEARLKAKKNSITHPLQFIQGDAEEINLPSNSVDLTGVAYGIRNIKHPEKCMAEVYRVLTEGGSFGILELTRPNNKILRLLHAFYLKAFLPLIGKCVTSNKEAYNYLSSSIEHFLNPVEVKDMLLKTGFSSVKIIPLLGGIATLLIAKKG